MTHQPPVEPPAGRSDEPPEDPRRVTLRRAPRYRAFVLTGVALGMVVAAALYAMSPGGAANFSARTVFGYLAAGLGLFGGVLGGLAAVLVERPRRR